MQLTRRLHKIWAGLAGYFWLPCPLCGEMFGGHEWKTSALSSTIMTSWHTATGVCPNCHKTAKEYNDKWMRENPHLEYQAENKGVGK